MPHERASNGTYIVIVHGAVLFLVRLYASCLSASLLICLYASMCLCIYAMSHSPSLFIICCTPPSPPPPPSVPLPPTSALCPHRSVRFNVRPPPSQ
ncbi:hypothetical protein B484DRAFT_452176 [Ochromonadaceae sp. CCMP2298]|nr:hypothetical protein B484DRAFT_452176 [Ochromonadaceae sp. CCMP2298]